MKTVFIFGAGASRLAGGPLMYDFLDRSSSLYRQRETNFDSTDSFEDVFRAMRELSGIYEKAFLDLDNIEVLFGAIETAQLTGKFGPRTKEEDIRKLRESIITLIYKTLEAHIQFPIEGSYPQSRVVAPAPYPKFMSMLKNLKENQNKKDPHEFSFLTFNYDVCLDYALQKNLGAFDYFLEDPPSGEGSPLLKLHGSINWGACKKCNKVHPIALNKIQFDNLFDNPYTLMDLGSKLTEFLKPCCEKNITGPPVLVPPTWNKTDYHLTLSRVWKKASKELGTADNIFVIGYSLPETDSFFRYLYALGSEGETPLKNFCVVDPDESGDVEKRYRSLLGKGINERRKNFLKTDFNAGISKIKKIILEAT
jgi:hypothetical protein